MAVSDIYFNLTLDEGLYSDAARDLVPDLSRAISAIWRNVCDTLWNKSTSLSSSGASVVLMLLIKDAKKKKLKQKESLWSSMKDDAAARKFKSVHLFMDLR